MSTEYITRGDLNQFKIDLIEEIRNLLSDNQPNTSPWLKGKQIRKLLNISPNTLQKLRINGTIKCNKVGGTLYYKLEDINSLMNTAGK